MSAFIVSYQHINYLVSALLKDQMIMPRECQSTAELLLKENYNSVNYRYHTHDIPHQVVFKPFPFDNIYPLLTIKAIGNFDHQACEHFEWKTSKTKQLLTELMNTAAFNLANQIAPNWDILYQAHLVS